MSVVSTAVRLQIAQKLEENAVELKNYYKLSEVARVIDDEVDLCHTCTFVASLLSYSLIKRKI